MTSRDKQLLNNALDSLDRLFDRHTSAIDVSALLLATSEALRATPHQSEFQKPIEVLQEVVASGEPPDEQRARALAATDALRHYLATVV